MCSFPAGTFLKIMMIVVRRIVLLNDSTANLMCKFAKFSVRASLALLIGLALVACGCEAGGSGGAGSLGQDPKPQYSADMKNAIEKNLASKNQKAPKKTSR
jgi:hypothetical protein